MEWYDISNLIIGALALAGGLGAAYVNYTKTIQKKWQRRLSLSFEFLIALAGLTTIITTFQGINERNATVKFESEQEDAKIKEANKRDTEFAASITRLNLISDSLSAVKTDLTKAIEISSLDLLNSIYIKREVANIIHNIDTLYLLAHINLDIRRSYFMASNLDTFNDYLKDVMANVQFRDNNGKIVFSFANTPTKQPRFIILHKTVLDSCIKLEIEFPLTRESINFPEPPYLEMSGKRVDVNIVHVGGIDLKIPWTTEDASIMFDNKKYKLDIPKVNGYYSEKIDTVNLFRRIGNIDREWRRVNRQ
ncbi:MAG: hypothetical protein WAT61_09515 [Flavobacteriales bacterium]|nr:hypothetical protein [Flavobacteriales bacterium]